MRRFLFAAVFLFLALNAAAAEPRIERLAAEAAHGLVTVRFALANAFDAPEFEQALQSGLPTGFTYHIQIVRKRPNWFDDTIATSTIEVISTYNSVTKEYLLNYRRDRKLVRSETYVDLASLRQAMTTIEEPDLFSIGGRRAYKMVVRARADVARGFLLYLIPRDISTEWRTTRVRTSTAAPAR
ncbi:MAG: DUF4390 domain-containing protein [Thermoanaerobaculia bacterium]